MLENWAWTVQHYDLHWTRCLGLRSEIGLTTGADMARVMKMEAKSKIMPASSSRYCNIWEVLLSSCKTNDLPGDNSEETVNA